jgi:hypothetical protein
MVIPELLPGLTWDAKKLPDTAQISRGWGDGWQRGRFDRW